MIKVCIDNKTLKVTKKSPEKPQKSWKSNQQLQGTVSIPFSSLFVNLESSIRFFQPIRYHGKSTNHSIFFGWRKLKQPTIAFCTTQAHQNCFLKLSLPERGSMKKISSKYIKLQRWYNRKNIISWQILQKLPSKSTRLTELIIVSKTLFWVSTISSSVERPPAMPSRLQVCEV